MSSTPTVVVTGLGATTPLGGDVESTWRAALAGRSGVRTLENDWAEKYEMAVTFAGQLAVPSADVLTRPEMKRMDPSAQYAMIAAREAWADAGSPEVDGDRLGSVVASGIGGIWTLLDAWDVMKEKGARRVLPMTVPMLMANSPAAYVSIEFGARAGAHAPVSACASGAEAIAYGVQMIRSGRADLVLCGGTEAAIHPLPITAFASMQALSTRNDDPAGASRPYDVTRDGFVLGEGAGMIVLESAEHAADSARLDHVADHRRRGVRVDVDDVSRVQGGVREGEPHRGGLAAAARFRCGDVVRIRGDADATERRVDADASRRGVLGALQHDHARALAEHEPVTRHVVGPRSAGRIVVAGRERLHRRERSDRKWVDRRLGATAEHDVSSARADHLGAGRDRLGAGRARGDGGVCAGPGAELDRDIRGGGVRHQHRDRHREHSAGALGLHDVPRVEQGPDPAEPGRHDRLGTVVA